MTPRLRSRSVLALAGALALVAACGPSGGGGGTDAGTVGGTDGGTTDGGTVGGTDGGTTDGGTVGGTDGGTTDGGTVGGTDGGTTDGGTAGSGTLTGALTLDLVAGDTGGPGSLDGTGTDARLDAPWGIVGDAAGNLYVTDRINDTIRKIDPTGAVTTFAGQPTRIPATPVDGKGTAATFGNVFGIAIGPNGNLYVSEANDVRKIAPDGTVTTLAGTLGAPAGDQDGTGSAASFDIPAGIGVDAQGNVFVAEPLSNVIREITPAGVVTTLAGQAGQRGQADGTGSAARFDGPKALAVGPAGNVWVADGAGIREITPAGVVTTPDPGATAGGLAFDGQGRLLYDTFAGVNRIDAAGATTVVAGATLPGYADGPAASARLLAPKGLYADGSGDVFIAGELNSCVREVSAAGAVTTVAGLGPTSAADVNATGADARFLTPQRIASDGQGGAYVLEKTGSVTTLRHVDAAGAVTTVFQSQRNVDPTLLAATPDGTAYVVGKSAGFNPQIDSVGGDGTLTPFAGGAAGGADGQGTAAGLGNIQSLTADAAGNLWLVDLDLTTYKSRIRKIAPDGTVTTLASRLGIAGKRLAVDANGDLYALSGFSVVALAADGTSQTLAGQLTAMGSTDGQGSAARFSTLDALVAGPGGDVFVADTDNGLIRRITPGGKVTTLLGIVDQRKIVPGPTPTTIDAPTDLAFAKDGSLLILDGNAVLRLRPR